MARTLLAIAALALIGTSCSPGPLPDLPNRPAQAPQVDYKQYWFPTDSAGPLPLDLAIQSGDLDEVRRLLEHGENPNLRWGESGDRFPLQEAFEGPGFGYRVGDPAALVQLLLRHGADPNARWCPFESRGPSEWLPSCTAECGMTALNFAAIVGRRDIVGLLLAAGADPNLKDFTSRAALEYASDEVVFEMISRRLFPDLSTRDQKTLEWLNEGASRFGMPLLRALISLDNGQYVIAPPRAEADLWDRHVEGEERMLSRVRTLLRIGADPNMRVTSDRPLLLFALYNRTLRVARALLQGGADVNQRWCELFTAPWASVASSPNHLIVREGDPRKDPSCTLENGITPLMWSAASDDGNAVRLLLEFNADRSLKDWAGRSALDYAMTDKMRNLLTTGQ